MSLPVIAEARSESEETLNSPENEHKKEDSRDSDDQHSTLGTGTFRDIAGSARRRLHLQKVKASGPGSGFNPTSARFHIWWKDEEDDSNSNGVRFKKQDTGDEVALRWSSRYNRKGRNSFVVSRSDSIDQQSSAARWRRTKSNLSVIGKNIFRMFFTFPYWDMAFWSGWAYSWGSVLFVIDGAFSWVPLAFPETKFKGEDYGVGFLFFFGALLYEVGATIAYFEAINDGSFHGSAMKRFLEGHEEDQKRMLDEKLHAFFGRFNPRPSIEAALPKPKPKPKPIPKRVTRPRNYIDIEAGWNPGTWEWDPLARIESFESVERARRGGVDYGTANESETVEHLPWRWWPTWQNFKTHHVREIGWWACSIQLFGATLYAITGVVALPGILDTLAQWQENAAYWIPQIVASACFLTASLLFTLETQEKWYKPELKVLGWWVGFWACVGSMGFLLCGCLGPAYGSYGAQYQSDLSSMWGSAAYLMSGLLQWYEAVNKHPIEELLNEPGEMKSFQVHPV